jgi:hypothetical protein
MSLVSSVLFKYKTQAPELVRRDASHRKGRVIKAAQPVLCNHKNRQLHCRS